MSASKKGFKPNVLNVAIVLLIMCVALGGAYAMAKAIGIASFQIWHTIGFAALLLTAAVGALVLIVWSFSWVRNERVSELGLHIVRFAVILCAVALSVFVMLSVDYTNQYKNTVSNELEQQALAARVYVQNCIGSEVLADEAYYGKLEQDINELLDQNGSNSDRHVVLYLRDPNGYGAESEFITFSSSQSEPASADEELLWSVIRSGEVQFAEYSPEVSRTDLTGTMATMQTPNYYSALTPVYTASGKPAGVLELCERRPVSASVFSFASLELFLIVAAIICMFSFLFYGFMQLLDIALRPRKFDKSRQVLSCGREAVRPVLFFVTLTAALPVMMFFYSPAIRELVTIDGLGERVCNVLPLLLYLLGIGIGMLISKGYKVKLTEMPSNAALAVAVLCNICLILLLDWEKLASNSSWSNWLTVFILILISGIGYGVSYRTISKFQGQSDALFGNDKYAYLCSCLGAIAGLILGALLMDVSGDLTVRIFLLVLSVATCVISVLLLEDLDNVRDVKKSHVDQLTKYNGAVLSICAVGMACCFDWVYITDYLHDRDYSAASLAFCVAAPIIAFCFGNRLHLRTRKSQRAALVIGAVVAAIAFVPMIFFPSALMAFVSCMITSIAVIFAAGGLYSSMKYKEERTICLGKVRPLLFVGVLAFALILNLPTSRIFLLVAAILALAAGLGVILTAYPERFKVPKVHKFAGAGLAASEPIAQITDGGRKEESEPKEKPEKKAEKKEEPAQPKPEPAEENLAEEPPVIVFPEEKEEEQASEDTFSTDIFNFSTAGDSSVSPFDTPPPPPTGKRPSDMDTAHEDDIPIILPDD